MRADNNNRVKATEILFFAGLSSSFKRHTSYNTVEESYMVEGEAISASLSEIFMCMFIS